MREFVIVTGASGFIGQRLVKRLQGLGRPVAGWTREWGDLRDRSAIQSVFAELKPTKVFHLAAGPAADDNAPWTRVADEQRMVANLAYEMSDQCQLICAGSMAEYGHSGTFRGSDYCAPDTAYGSAKYAATNLALALRRLLDRDIRVARLFGVYGPGERDTRLLPALVRQLSAGQPVPLSDGLQIRDFVHVDDVIEVITAFSAFDEAPALVNVGTGVGVTVGEVCKTVASALGADPALLHFGELPRRAVDQDCLIAQVDELRTFVPPPIQRWSVPELAAACVAEFVGDTEHRQVTKTPQSAI